MRDPAEARIQMELTTSSGRVPPTITWCPQDRGHLPLHSAPSLWADKGCLVSLLLGERLGTWGVWLGHSPEETSLPLGLPHSSEACRLQPCFLPGFPSWFWLSQMEDLR